MNEVKDMTRQTGTLSNIRTFDNKYGTLLTGWFEKRVPAITKEGEPYDRLVYSTNVVSTNPEIIKHITQLDLARVNTKYTPTLVLEGSMENNSYYAKEDTAKTNKIYKTQLVIESVSLLPTA
ncbi:hypothetical protein UFOVP999_26 [uncultured Caudovirales phage]|uniref:Uncharacterized protein n=1 Tax=uncultured Caudovirales phage TaxID=2100421 RepID=A0A6J5Q3U1_9CAUD|nr:hypothetical protein UFOVP999_26 [uncultured Caudovirales phage]